MEDSHPDEQFPCVASRNGVYIKREEIRQARESGSLIEVNCTGCGCTLIKTAALEKIGTPAFKFDWHLAGNHSYVRGEDEWFCQRAIAAGMKVYIDPLIMPNHYSVMQSNYTLADFNGYQFYTPNY
jgi:hypothetical protein